MINDPHLPDSGLVRPRQGCRSVPKRLAIGHLLGRLVLAAGVIGGLLGVATPPAHAGFIQRLVIGDGSGVGVSGEGVLNFRTEAGSCSGSACFELLDGIYISFADSEFQAGDYWEIPGRVESATWSIDQLTGRLTGSMLLFEKDRLAPALDFTGGVATNRETGSSGPLVTFPIPEPNALLLVGVGGLVFAWVRRRWSMQPQPPPRPPSATPSG